jgi:steroid delta-isomerase-like uncharacterized protein
MTGFIDEVWDACRFDRAEAYIDPEHDLGALGRGPDASATNARAFREAFPDLRVRVMDVVEQGSRVAVWMQLSGTQHGDFRGHPASSRHGVWDEVGFFTVDDGRIRRGRYLADMFVYERRSASSPPVHIE